jgi:hypothetical protein
MPLRRSIGIEVPTVGDFSMRKCAQLGRQALALLESPKHPSHPFLATHRSRSPVESGGPRTVWVWGRPV